MYGSSFQMFTREKLAQVSARTWNLVLSMMSISLQSRFASLEVKDGSVADFSEGVET